MASLMQAITRRFYREPNEASVAAEQSNSSRRHSMLNISARSTAERDRITNVELATTLAEAIRLNERRLVYLEIEEEKLIETNLRLRAEVIELTGVLEAKWLQRSDEVAATISDLFTKFKALHQHLSAQHAEAERIQRVELTCLTNDGKEWDNKALTERLGKDYLSKSGFSLGVRRCWSTYSCLCIEDKLFIPLQQLHQTFRDTFAVAIQAKMRSTVLAPVDAELSTSLQLAQSSAMVPFQPIDVLRGSVQQQSSSQEALRNRNIQIQNENSSLEQKKTVLQEMGPKFTDYFRSQLSPSCLQNLHSSALAVIKKCEENRKDHLQKLAEMDPWDRIHSRTGTSYHAELELAQHISPALQDMVQLIEQIQKGCPKPQSTI